MSAKLRIGVVGLGGIAQKAWLPVLGAADDWTLQAAWSPGKEKALRICETWRIPYADSLEQLAAQCDAVFVHTSTASHYEVVSRLLNAGVHVCVDKPLADKLSDAEALVELAARRHLTLMVGFNRRFAPLYRELKAQIGSAASLRMDKHRSNSVGHDLRFTLLDDYLHVVDTALWLAGDKARLSGGTLHTTAQGEMLYEVRDMREWQEERGRGVIQRPVPGWQTTLEQRGFTGCARHFIECVQNQTVPETSGEQALLAQRVIEKLWRAAMSE